MKKQEFKLYSFGEIIDSLRSDEFAMVVLKNDDDFPIGCKIGIIDEEICLLQDTFAPITLPKKVRDYTKETLHYWAIYDNNGNMYL